MTRVTFAPATAADLAWLPDGPPKFRFWGLTGRLDGAIAGILGFVFPPSGPVLGSAEISDPLRRHPVSLHRAGLALHAWAREQGLTLILAEADPQVGRSAAWLERLGYERLEGRVYAWRPVTSDNAPSRK